MSKSDFRAAEFFAGIGLVRRAIEEHGFVVVFANDIEPNKHAMYAANFDATHFVLGDVCAIRGSDVPDIDLATASFPCTDLSLAGDRAGLGGRESGMFWEFARIIDEMAERRPKVIMLENVVGFATSNGGEDMAAAIRRLNGLGYVCDLFTLNARWFVPQSRPRLFVVGSRATLTRSQWEIPELRPAWIRSFAVSRPDLKMQAFHLPAPPKLHTVLGSCVTKIAPSDKRWWDEARLARFLESLSPIQAARLAELQQAPKYAWAAAYRRTRRGHAVWEIRPDAISGCLRTAKGGSSKQAVVEAGRGRVRVRWMMAIEYARLQGVPDFKIDGVRESAALFGFGDAVCVPAVAWIVGTYLRPLLEGKLTKDTNQRRVAVYEKPQTNLRLSDRFS